MNSRKISVLLVFIFIVSVTLVAFNFDYLRNSFLPAPEVLAPAPQPNPETEADAVTQLLQQAGVPANKDSPIPAAADETLSSEDLLTLEEALQDFYSSEDEQDREAALMTLGEYPDPKAKEAILYALNDPEDIVREQAVSQISNWEDEKERQQMLLTALNNDKRDIVVLALEAVDVLDDPTLIQKIKELSGNKDEDISEAAKAALEMTESN